MKILYIASGLSIHSYKWISFFSEEHDVIWVSTNGFSEEFLGNTNITYLDYHFTKNNLANSIIGIFKIILDSKKIDILHLHYIGFHSLLTLFLKNNRFIITAWGSDIVFGSNSIFKKKILLSLLKRSHLITCDSSHMKEKILNLVSTSSTKIINFGIDTKKFKKTSFNHDFKKNLSLSSKNIVISTRSHEDIYDISTFIKSAKYVTDKHPDTTFIIAGQGSQTLELKKEVESLSLIKNIIFTGSLNNEEIFNFLSISTIYVSTALSDGGIAASTAEAMSSEIPCIITDVADNSEWITDGVTGMLFNKSDPIHLSNKISMLINDKLLRKNIGKNARKLIQEKNDFFREMQKMNKLYKYI